MRDFYTIYMLVNAFVLCLLFYVLKSNILTNNPKGQQKKIKNITKVKGMWILTSQAENPNSQPKDNWEGIRFSLGHYIPASSPFTCKQKRSFRILKNPKKLLSSTRTMKVFLLFSIPFSFLLLKLILQLKVCISLFRMIFEYWLLRKCEKRNLRDETFWILINH